MLIGCVLEWSKEQEQEVFLRKGENKEISRCLQFSLVFGLIHPVSISFLLYKLDAVFHLAWSIAMLNIYFLQSLA